MWCCKACGLGKWLWCCKACGLGKWLWCCKAWGKRRAKGTDVSGDVSFQVAAFSAVVMGVVVSALGVFVDPALTDDAIIRSEVGEAGVDILDYPDDNVDAD